MEAAVYNIPLTAPVSFLQHSCLFVSPCSWHGTSMLSHQTKLCHMQESWWGEGSWVCGADGRPQPKEGFTDVSEHIREVANAGKILLFQTVQIRCFVPCEYRATGSPTRHSQLSQHGAKRWKRQAFKKIGTISCCSEMENLVKWLKR